MSSNWNFRDVAVVDVVVATAAAITSDVVAIVALVRMVLLDSFGIGRQNVSIRVNLLQAECKE